MPYYPPNNYNCYQLVQNYSQQPAYRSPQDGFSTTLSYKPIGVQYATEEEMQKETSYFKAIYKKIKGDLINELRTV